MDAVRWFFQALMDTSVSLHPVLHRQIHAQLHPLPPLRQPGSRLLSLFTSHCAPAPCRLSTLKSALRPERSDWSSFHSRFLFSRHSDQTAAGFTQMFSKLMTGFPLTANYCDSKWLMQICACLRVCCECADNLICDTVDPREAITWRPDICCSATWSQVSITWQIGVEVIETSHVVVAAVKIQKSGHIEIATMHVPTSERPQHRFKLF